MNRPAAVLVVVYSQSVNLAVLHLRENGQLATLQKKWWQDKGECVGDDKKVSTLKSQSLLLFHRLSVAAVGTFRSKLRRG